MEEQIKVAKVADELQDIQTLKQAAEQAANYQIENFQYKKDSNTVKKQFVSIIQELDPNIFNVEDKDTDEYRLKQNIVSSFNLTKQLIHSVMKYEKQEDIKNKMDKFIGQFAFVMAYLEYIGKTELAEPYLKKYGLEVKSKSMVERYPDLERQDVKQTIVDCFEDAFKLESKIENNVNLIKEEEFVKLPTHLKFDKQSNKSGINQNDFANMVKIEAIAQIKEQKAKEQVEKIKDKNLAKATSNILYENVLNEIVKEIQ